MEISIWLSQAEVKVSQMMEQDINLLSFLELMRTFKTLYPVLFPEQFVLKQLNKDLDDGIDQTITVMKRLKFVDGSVEDFIKLEIKTQKGVNNCKDRKTSGVISVLWLNRILWFMTNVVVNIMKQSDSAPIKHAYAQTLRRYHGFISSKLFDTTLSICSSSARTIHIIRQSPMDQLSNVNSKLYKIYMKNFNVFMKHGANFLDKI
jgi:hypothetical protein